MGLRCKPGDLALVTKQNYLICVECNSKAPMFRLGAVIRVTAIDEKGNWTLEESMLLDTKFGCGLIMTGTVVGIGDDFLTPLPGNDLLEEKKGSLNLLVPA